MTSVADLQARLRELHAQTEKTPLFNPVFQLSLELSRSLESGELQLSDFETLIAELECDSLKQRAARLRSLIQPASELSPFAQQSDSFSDFQEKWGCPHLHAVFTAHPTFLLSPSQSEAIGRAAADSGEVGEDVCTVPSERPPISLPFEHERAMQALTHAQDARDRIVTGLLEEAARRWPDRWHELAPLPFRFATWVGYDMDGRTDIAWHTSIGFRLAEKALRLERYAETLRSIDAGHPLLGKLRSSAEFTRERAADFADLKDSQALTEAADRLTDNHPDKLTSLDGLIASLEEEAGECALDRAIRLKTLSAAMRADGLGMGWIHFRVNASQLHNAVRQRLDQDVSPDFASKGAVAALRKLLERVNPLRANFAALAVESSSAIRQFLAMQQILRHIDSDAPIRLLIAECEYPSTVLSALYFSRLFGIEDMVDVSPLFETETALEQGGRIIDAILSEKAYREYAKARGRLCIQTGFSDAGRFVGQIPASLAIERLQGRLADAMRTNGLCDVAALIFNTHGESMGRGAHPSSFGDRLAWALSPWARRRFADAGIRIEPEVSFQGGDGYLFFANPDLALATLSRIVELCPTKVEEVDAEDQFYRRTDLSLDFYRAIKEHQHDYLESRTYVRAVTAFGLGLLAATGSRKTRRQSDLAIEREMSLRQIRAIPHNAILQQLGYPVNVIAGVGSAAAGNFEEIVALLARSERGRALIRLVRSANSLASIKTVAAYGELFNSAYWASRTYRGTEPQLSASCQALAEYLIQDDRAGVFRRLASRLRVDALKLHRLLEQLPDELPFKDRERVRRSIGVLHALRLALLQHMFLKVVAIPVFARANDISREDVIEMVFALRIEEALAQLRRAYPTDFPTIEDFSMAEESQYPDRPGEPYLVIRRDYIAAIERAHTLSLQISAAIANHFGAHG